MTKGEADNPAALAKALLCAGDLDAAAALYVRRLGDPALRESALLTLQHWAPQPAGFTFRAVLEKRLEQLRDRPDVRRATLAVGRIERFDLPTTYGDL